MRQLVQSEETTVGIADGSQNFTFPVAYSDAPSLMVTIKYPGANSDGLMGVSAITAGGFTVEVDNTVGGNLTVWWRSSGTVAL